MEAFKLGQRLQWLDLGVDGFRIDTVRHRDKATDRFDRKVCLPAGATKAPHAMPQTVTLNTL